MSGDSPDGGAFAAALRMEWRCLGIDVCTCLPSFHRTPLLEGTESVLEARCGIPFAGLDVYLNVAGGMKVSEPAADLAVAAASLPPPRVDPALGHMRPPPALTAPPAPRRA